jgi:hypothetical protein
MTRRERDVGIETADADREVNAGRLATPWWT